MSREIKFRGISEKTNKFIYGNFVTDGRDYSAIVYENENDSSEMFNEPVISKTVGQYTGLKDVNGVEVYEGDKIRQHLEWSGGYGSDESGEMEFVGVASITASSGVVLNKCQSRDLTEWDSEFTRHRSTINVRGYRCEVIGNIHEGEIK